MKPEIRTERLVLLQNKMGSGFGVTATRDRAALLFSSIDHDRERLQKRLPWVAGTKSPADSEAYLERCAEGWASETLFDYSIFLHSGEFVGCGGLHSVSRPNARAEIGYWILEAFEGGGYMTEAIAGLTREAFRDRFHRLEIRCSAENIRSYAIAERLGFRLEGTLREDSMENGKLRSTKIYGLLATDPIIF